VRISFRQIQDVRRADLFAFHTDPGNLGVLLAGWRGFELLSHSGHIRPGARVTLVQALGPLRFRMTFEHFLLEPPERFGERLVDGPFTTFEHVHAFEAEGERTAIVDEVSFELPWYRGGRIAERLIAAPLLRRFFAFRQEAYGRLIREHRIGSR
jgi:ligand-binding SRPBCC domain-containing protein